MTLTGIDTFALTSLHENEHMSHLRQWWLGPAGAPIDKFVRAGRDIDNDDVLDTAEAAVNATYGGEVMFWNKSKDAAGNPVDRRKSNAGIPDEEFYTQLKAHGRLTVGAFDKQDWAYPGKQWAK